MKASPVLGDLTESHDNNFNLIRMIAAIAVLVAHSFTLVTGDARNEPFSWVFGKSIGSMAVDFFFVASGLLITGSLLRRPSIREYALSRILRIFPALILANLLCVVVLGPLVTSEHLLSYFSNGHTFKFFVLNNTLLVGLQYQLPGVFGENPYPFAVNGSLWTLPHELRMYILIALSYVLSGLIAGEKKEKFLSIIVPSAAIIGLAIHFLSEFALIDYFHGKKWPWLLFLFFSGASLFLHRNKIKLSTRAFTTLFFLLCVSAFNSTAFGFFYSFVVPYMVIYLAYIPGGLVRKYNYLGDYSYGVYIYAFPVQQSIVFFFPDSRVGDLILSSLLATLTLSVLSWTFVEKPSLGFKKTASLLLARVRFRNAS